MQCSSPFTLGHTIKSSSLIEIDEGDPNIGYPALYFHLISPVSSDKHKQLPDKVATAK